MAEVGRQHTVYFGVRNGYRDGGSAGDGGAASDGGGAAHGAKKVDAYMQVHRAMLQGPR